MLCKLESALLMRKSGKNSLRSVCTTHEIPQSIRTTTRQVTQGRDWKGNRENTRQGSNPTSTRGNICQSVVRPASPAQPLGHFRMEKWPWERPPHLQGTDIGAWTEGKGWGTRAELKRFPGRDPVHFHPTAQLYWGKAVWAGPALMEPGLQRWEVGSDSSSVSQSQVGVDALLSEPQIPQLRNEDNSS